MIKRMGDYLQYLTIRLSLLILGIFPHSLKRKILRGILRFVAMFLKRHRNIAHKNLSLAFPEMREDERQRMFIESFCSLNDLVLDLARFPTIDRAWAIRHIEAPGIRELRKVKDASPEKGVLLIAGHLGSFELSAYTLPLLYRPISFLVREFTNPVLDSWWKNLRESNGNKTISKTGGYKEMLRLLKRGQDVGILFDQNVTRKNALFIDWFGRPAATTKAVAHAALKTRASVFVIALIVVKTDQYFYECINCDCTDIYDNKLLTKTEKLVSITTRMVRHYEELIKKYPESWFWMHRRWKTEADGESEDFYKDC